MKTTRYFVTKQTLCEHCHGQGSTNYGNDECAPCGGSGFTDDTEYDLEDALKELGVQTKGD